LANRLLGRRIAILEPVEPPDPKPVVDWRRALMDGRFDDVVLLTGVAHLR
jgi:hypothetical protein